MPWGLQRFQQSGQIHSLTFSCYHRQPRLGDPRRRNLFLRCLEQARLRYRFRVYAYVVMPEHVHLLVSEPESAVLATALQSLKLSVSKRARREPGEPAAFWQKRYYDHNVRTYTSFVAKVQYIHRNPVKRGLVAQPEDWGWSSFRHYALGEIGVVEIESDRTVLRRESKAPR